MARRPPEIGFDPLNPPAEPHTYNDPRFCYNEPCLMYNGGFDLQCLFDRNGVGRIKGGRSTGRQYPEPEVVDLLFKTCVVCVNDEKFEPEFCEEKKYSFKKDSDITIKTSDLRVKSKERDAEVSASLNEIKESRAQISASNSIIKTKKQTGVSSSFAKLKTEISSSIKSRGPRKIIIKSNSIKIKKKD